MDSIFSFQKTQDYLRSYISALPRKGWGEVKRWGDHLAVQGSFISQVLSGAKVLNTDQGVRLAELLGLRGVEVDYFIAMIEKEKAGHHLSEKYFENKMNSLKKEARQIAKRLVTDTELTDEQKGRFYSSWIFAGIKNFCSLPNGKTLTEITEKFQLSSSEAIEILQFLCESGLCRKDGTVYVVGHLKTHLDRKSPYIQRHWTNWHLKAIQQFDRVSEDELIYSAPFTISAKDFEIAREELVQFIQRLSKRVSATSPEDVAIVNLNLMKLR
jgi:uncharacterized protein (TIGR02147 family)